MPDLHTTLWTYPWDLADGDARAIAKQLRDDVGLDGISLASAYHTFEMLRPHSPKQVLLQIPQAAVYFRPDADLYADTPIKPHASPLMGGENWYADAAEAAAGAGIELIAWTVFLHNSFQAGRHPECAEVTCTGDVSTSWLCPANPGVRAFAAALARDLVANYGIALLECESLSYGGFGHTHYHVKHGVDLGPGGRMLLSLCFCDACRTRAKASGLDPDALSRSVEIRLRQTLASGKPPAESREELIAAVPQLEPFVRMRDEVVASLLEEVKAAAGVHVSSIFMGDRFNAAINRSRLAEIADYAETLAYTPDADRIGAAISEIVPDLKNPRQLVVGLQAYPPASPDAATLSAGVKRALDLGIRRFSFYNYGIMPPANLAWIKQSIGDARRACEN
ncbi:MAG: hypothetical protein OXU79_15470 [Gemmatimonadota bacterium]|nr:hypothetical protein [Gemmatimonadota bacterium]